MRPTAKPKTQCQMDAMRVLREMIPEFDRAQKAQKYHAGKQHEAYMACSRLQPAIEAKMIEAKLDTAIAPFNLVATRDVSGVTVTKAERL